MTITAIEAIMAIKVIRAIIANQGITTIKEIKSIEAITAIRSIKTFATTTASIAIKAITFNPVNTSIASASPVLQACFAKISPNSSLARGHDIHCWNRMSLDIKGFIAKKKYTTT